MMTKLERFEIDELPEGYALTVAGADGDTLEFEVTAEQIDAIVRGLDNLLGRNEAAADEVSAESDAATAN